MEPRRHSNVPPAKRLCLLARDFRGTRDEKERAFIAESYAEAVEQLIKSDKWKRIPMLEDQLPDEWMPKQFWLMSPDR
jgi:hypothetical protein